MSTTHILVIEPDTKYAEQFPDADPEVLWRVECSDPAACPAWEECSETHELDGLSAADGPYDCPEEFAWFDEVEFTFHGVEHTWRYGWGWTVEFAGCPVGAFRDAELPEDMPQPVKPGRYVIDVEWDDDSCTLLYVGPEAA